MITFKDYTENCTCFTYTLLRFKSQTKVVYDTPVADICLSKSDLIACIKYILFRLSQLGYLDKIKHGFVLDKFKYFELSVYLHGLCQVYSGLIGMPSVGELYIKCFSHLPHDVMKSEKYELEIEITSLHDVNSTLYYVTMALGTPLYALTIEHLERMVRTSLPESRYILRFIVK